MARPKKYKTEAERKKAREESKKKWVNKNKDKVAYIRAKSSAKLFVEMSEDEDVEMLEKWIKERKEKGKMDDNND
ncbi:hypothetical protein [Candidatus Enterococcus courvalinii]|uniref:Uncharacterized protein n=1 Tax=Candidatus Enterococcus courvalinii TaxID=2815329 RepID=A0ABS3HYH4_9ENTE|nr:hypothetical protein [Enterococcus sp. MSG2901]MBO0481518.1 hypothetical protein [Enterococcus sp. MSG2901]